MSAKLQDLKRRFLDKLEVSGGHWLWCGTLNAHGQPVFSVGGRGSPPTHPYRISFLLFRNQIVKGWHRQCDEPLCIKPDHWARNRKKKSCNPYWGQHREGSSWVKPPSG